MEIKICNRSYSFLCFDVNAVNLVVNFYQIPILFKKVVRRLKK